MPIFAHDELTATAVDALACLSAVHKASFLLDSAVALIEAGQYGPEVERYLDVYLRTPGLDNSHITKALLVRGSARKNGGQRLLAMAQQDFNEVLKLDPRNREVHKQLKSGPRQKRINFQSEPAPQRTPLEIWDRIAQYIPRYHLRAWLFLSPFHRSIASRLIFHTIDIYFGSEDPDNVNLNRGLDIFDRAKTDKVFAARVKVMRVHWAYEEGEMLDLMMRIFRGALGEFHELKEFEWIGYPELRAEMVQSVLHSHPRLTGLGLIGWHFDAVGVSAFRNLSKFTLRAEDDDGFADMNEIRAVLDANEHSLRHLILGAYLLRTHSWDTAFQSTTIKNLTHLDLVDTKISHFVFARIAHAAALQSLTLHGTFEEPCSAAVVFGSDQIIEKRHTFLPHLECFRFVLVDHDNDMNLYQAVVHFLRHRRLRRLDLGTCPWELVVALLPTISDLRCLGVRISNLTQQAIGSLVCSVPYALEALSLSCVVAEKPLNEYTELLAQLRCLSFLHLHSPNKGRPKPNLMSEKEYVRETEAWTDAARGMAIALPSLDYLGWCGEHYLVLRDHARLVELKELPSQRQLDCCKGVDLGSEHASWLERKDVPMDYEVRPSE